MAPLGQRASIVSNGGKQRLQKLHDCGCRSAGDQQPSLPAPSRHGLSLPMLERLFKAFSAPTPEPLPEPDEKLALGVLMVRVAKSDSNYKVSEISRIDRLLARLNGLKPIEAAKMRATCEKLDKAAPPADEFAHLIRETVSFAARIDALEALWEVVLADGERRDEEIAVVNEVREALGLSEADSDKARVIAEDN